jgi:hypothetical protein
VNGSNVASGTTSISADAVGWRSVISNPLRPSVAPAPGRGV